MTYPLTHTSTKNTMKLILLRNLLLALLLIAPTFALAQPWAALTPLQQQALAPLANEWSTLTEKQQKNFTRIANRYPQLTPIQQQRLQERMVRWSKLSPEARKQAREKYKSFNQLPPEKREVIKQTLRERHDNRKQTAASAVMPATPAK